MINYILQGAIVPSTIVRALIFCVVAYAVGDISQKKTQALIYFQEYMKARRIITKMLPQQLPNTETITFAAYYHPAENIGGDYYNVIRIKDKLVICIADASGHAMDGSILSFYINAMMNAYLSFQAELNAALSPKSILQYLAKQYEQENYPEEYLVCIFIAVYDLSTDELCFAGAGYQTSPLIAMPGGEIRELTARGLPLSSALPLNALSYTEEVVKLEPGATVLLFTDGLVEQQTTRGAYGERVRQVFQHNYHLPPEQLIKAVNTDYEHFNGSQHSDDDITMLVMKIASPVSE